MALLYVALVAMAWGYTQVFTGRAAFLHLGAFTATIMSANVFFIIIPNQKIVVADLIAGRTPDPKYGAIAKQRSLHNNYLTLPVIFFMLSNHYRWPSARNTTGSSPRSSSSWASRSATGSTRPMPARASRPGPGP